jgi:hypothetical protein
LAHLFPDRKDRVRVIRPQTGGSKGEKMKRKMKLKSLAAILVAAFLVPPGYAKEGDVPKGVPHLDHVFVVMMENHGYSQIVGNPNAPFANHR